MRKIKIDKSKRRANHRMKMNKNIARIVDGIREAIDTGKVKRSDICKKLGVSQSQISEWIYHKRHTPNAENILKLSEYLTKINK